MKSVKFRMIAIALLSATMPFTAKAQDKVEASVGADFVSNYIWRGTDCGGVSIQPSMGVSYKGLSLTAWGSVGIDKEDAREIDLTLGYNTGGFSVSVTDYWFSYHKEDGGYTGDYFKYGAHSTVHIFEATLGYDFGPLALSWNTYFAGDDYTKENGDLTLKAEKEIKFTNSFSLPTFAQVTFNPHTQGAYFVFGVSF